MSDSAPRTFGQDFRRAFMRGLAVLLPSVITLWLVVAAYGFVHTRIAKPINESIKVGIINAAHVWQPLQQVFNPAEDDLRQERLRIAAAGGALPDERIMVARLRRDRILTWWDSWWILDAIGLLVAILAVYIAGRLLGGFVGRRLYRRLEGIITSLPVFKQVYPHVKQVVDFLFSDDQPIKFNRVVAAEYPRRGVWSIGFMTGDSIAALKRRTGELVTVFIPSSPTPFTGYTVSIPPSDVIELPITVDEAIRFAVSGGVLAPDSRGLPGDALVVSPGPPLPAAQAEPGAAPAAATGARTAEDARIDGGAARTSAPHGP
ncbi:MAG: DUF502 domain-containing protein [Phycisphaeraceae bacterium]|nr:DUF502 domain-containing protein [Phycisphaeraceae bacterium]